MIIQYKEPLAVLFTKKKLKQEFDKTKGMMSFDQFYELYKQARKVKSGAIVEVGSYRGRSTVALSMGARKGVKVFAIEPHEPFTGVLGGEFGPYDRKVFYKTMVNTGCYENVRLVNLSSETIVGGWREPVGLLFIDGDHSYEGVKRDFVCWQQHLSKGAAVVLDDTDHKNLGPAKLLEELVDNNTVSLDKQIGKVSVLKCNNW